MFGFNLLELRDSNNETAENERGRYNKSEESREIKRKNEYEELKEWQV